MKESRQTTEVSVSRYHLFLPLVRRSHIRVVSFQSFQDVWAVAVLPGAVREVHRAARRRQRRAHLRAEQDAGQEGLHRLWYEVIPVIYIS